MWLNATISAKILTFSWRLGREPLDRRLGGTSNNHATRYAAMPYIGWHAKGGSTRAASPRRPAGDRASLGPQSVAPVKAGCRGQLGATRQAVAPRSTAAQESIRLVWAASRSRSLATCAPRFSRWLSHWFLSSIAVNRPSPFATAQVWTDGTSPAANRCHRYGLDCPRS